MINLCQHFLFPTIKYFQLELFFCEMFLKKLRSFTIMKEMSEFMVIQNISPMYIIVLQCFR